MRLGLSLFLAVACATGCGSDDGGGGSGGSATGGSGGSATGGTGGAATGGTAGGSTGGAGGVAGSATGGAGGSGGVSTGGTGGSTGSVGCMNVGLVGDSSQCSCVYPGTPVTAGVYKDPTCTVSAATKCCFKAFHKTFNTNICMCMKGDALNPCAPYKDGWTKDPTYEKVADATSCPP